MTNSLRRLVCLLVCTFVLPVASAASDFVETLQHTHPDIKWDKASLVKADFNGDRVPDSAILGYKKKQVIVAIAPGHLQNGKAQLLKFGIGSDQDSICALPAKLVTEKLICATEGDVLPGCKVGAGAKGLALSGGECDSIHMYWNHKAKHMEWWRN